MRNPAFENIIKTMEMPKLKESCQDWVRKVVEKVERVQQDQKSIGPGYTVYENSR